MQSEGDFVYYPVERNINDASSIDVIPIFLFLILNKPVFQPLTIFEKNSLLDIWLGSRYTSAGIGPPWL